MHAINHPPTLQRCAPDSTLAPEMFKVMKKVSLLGAIWQKNSEPYVFSFVLHTLAHTHSHMHAHCVTGLPAADADADAAAASQLMCALAHVLVRLLCVSGLCIGVLLVLSVRVCLPLVS